MASLNKMIIIGNLGADPEVRYLDGGAVVATFNVATTEKFTNRNGEKVEQTEWFRIELWNEQAKVAEKYLKKGNSVYVEGRLRTEAWTDKEGKERTSLRVRANTMQLLGSPNSDRPDEVPYEAPRQQAAPAQSTNAPRPQAAPAPRQQPTGTPDRRREPEPVPFESNSGDDDLPF
ncbi:MULTISPECIES: single-stranded DNA-binding protein [unclassified Spirosoma]|uniref:single-stranded DNA-binding protein n=1 Tax=unclassified Spirosoma TaxID=2621999 RepID=UPI00095FA875|nr:MULTISPECIES: single-stranded DNA-binding protein [unclassified Spirosoma]MBN8824777.1 single-stranded DNA-binding protein [Spirosoma sp.]OJW77069.1 MAG: single-stranded DNA-binding protein [Spirosoma sp. 48-14]